MNRYDKEKIIIEDFRDLTCFEIGAIPDNSKTRKLYFSLADENCWENWIDTSAKNLLPPDFYNEKLKLMMDVMRIDDHAYVDEKGRIINRHNERESQLAKEIISKSDLFKDIAEQGNLFITPDSGLRGYQDHNYYFYISNFKRVVEKHIQKIDKYKQNHPGFKIVFFILDESSPYIKCFDDRPKNIGDKIFAQPHYWWLDNNMLSVIKNSEIDYLIWMCPYKYFKAEVELNLPKAIIYDVKKIKYSKLLNYDCKDMESLEI